MTDAIVLGSHPGRLTVRLTRGFPITLAAPVEDGYDGTMVLGWGARYPGGDAEVNDTATIADGYATWTLTAEQVDARIGYDNAQLVVDGRISHAGDVHENSGWSGSSPQQIVETVVIAGPPGPTAVSADAGNAAILGTDSLIYVGEAQIETAVEDYLTENPPAAAPDADATTKGILRLTGDLGGTADSPTVPGLADKANTSHTHATSDVTGLDAALAGKAATSHTHELDDLDATGATDGHVLTADGAGGAAWEAPASGGVTDHGDLTGLTDDDHPQYALADGSRGDFAASGHNHPSADISDSTTLGRALLTTVNAAAARASIDAAQTSHTHAISDTTGLQTALDGKAASSHTHTLSQVTDAGDAAGLDVGTTAGTVAAGDHAHAGVYQPAGSYAAASHAHAAADTTSGTFDIARIPTGTTGSTVALGNHTHSDYASATQTLNAQTGTSYTLQASDAGKIVTLTNAGAITLNAPGSVFTAGQRVDVIVLGAGMATVVGTSGATVNGTPTLVSRAQYSAFTVVWLTATSAVVVGDLAAA